MLEVEDWTQQPSHNKRRISSRKVSHDNDATMKDRDPASTPPSSPPAIPPGPPDAEAEDSFLVTHPPNSHLFPVRTRANSSPAVRPSSLSRLLAQASAQEPLLGNVPQSEARSPTPTISPPTTSQPPPSPIPQQPVIPSPLRPASRASRYSSTSKFSVGRLPALGSMVSGSPSATKAAPTTALTGSPLVALDVSSQEGNPFGSPVTPSPEESISDGTTNLISRRRTTSYHIPRTSPLAATASSQVTAARQALTATGTLANLASSWGVPFGKRKQSEIGNLTPTIEASVTEARGSSERPTTDASARELLRRF